MEEGNKFQYEIERSISKFESRTKILLDTKVILYRYYLILFLIGTLVFFSFLFKEKLHIFEISLIMCSYTLFNFFLHYLNFKKFNIPEITEIFVVFLEVTVVSLIGANQIFSSSYVSKTQINFVFLLYPIMIGFIAIKNRILLVNLALLFIIFEISIIHNVYEYEFNSTMIYIMFSILFGIVIQLVVLSSKYLIRVRTQFLFDLEKRELEKTNRILQNEISIRIKSEEESKKARSEANEQRFFLSKILERLPVGIYVKDSKDDFKYLIWNSMMEQFYKIKGDSVVGKNDFEILQNKEGIEEYIVKRNETEKEIINNGKIFEIEKDSIGSLLTYRDFHTLLVPFKMENKDFIVGIVQDFTERNEAQENLKRTLHFLENLQKAIDEHAMISITDRDGNILFVNGHFLEINGLDLEDCLGKPISMIKSNFHDSLFFDDLWKTILEGKVWKNEICNQSMSGKKYWIDCTIAPIISSNDKPVQFISISSLITKRKEAEEELVKALNKEKELAEFKSRLVSMISHEFRTPLTSVQLATETITRFSEKLKPEAKEKLFNNIRISCERMNELIDDALLMSKADSDKLSFKPELLRLADFCAHLLEETKSAVAEIFEIVYVIDSRLPEQVFLDYNLMKHILINVLNNAFKYSDKNKKIEFLINLKNGNLIEFIVKDYGIGIPDEEKNRIFDPFHRAKNVGTRYGTGLGMAIAKKSVELHGGKIHFESKEKEGTAFFIEIPLSKVETLS